jgi:hypothetical protein
MKRANDSADPELAIWERVFVPDPRRLTPEQTRYILDARFPQADLDRINELSAKANEGSLAPQEQTELERYIHVGHLLSILKAKVRGKLKKKAS